MWIWYLKYPWFLVVPQSYMSLGISFLHFLPIKSPPLLQPSTKSNLTHPWLIFLVTWWEYWCSMELPEVYTFPCPGMRALCSLPLLTHPSLHSPDQESPHFPLIAISSGASLILIITPQNFHISLALSLYKYGEVFLIVKKQLLSP